MIELGTFDLLVTETCLSYIKSVRLEFKGWWKKKYRVTLDFGYYVFHSPWSTEEETVKLFKEVKEILC